jgi:hypothetical protein
MRRSISSTPLAQPRSTSPRVSSKPGTMLVSQCISSLEEFNTHQSSVRRSKSHLPMNIFIDLKVMNPKSSLIFKATNYISDILFYHYLIAKRILTENNQSLQKSFDYLEEVIHIQYHIS